MNKLVSKNPVLRFKLGNRIIKAYTGAYLGRDGWYIADINNNSYTNPKKIVPEKIVPQKDGRILAKVNGKWYNLKGQLMSSKALKKDSNLPSQSVDEILESTGQQLVRNRINNLPKNLNSVVKPVVKPVVTTNRTAAGYTLPEGVTSVTDTQTMLKNAGFDLGKYGVDGVWGKDTLAAYDAWKNKLAANVGGTTGTTPNITSTPTSTGATVSGNGYRFILPTNTNANTNIYESYYPGTYSNLDNMFTRKGIRSNRGTNYSNVNEYWDWLLNNKDSEDYKVWSNIMGNDGYLNKEIFDNVMSQYGIRGNLGRRDSGRLSNLLNDLNLIGVQGYDKDGNVVMSDARRAFLTNFNRNLPSSEEINEYVRTNTPARPNLSTINWGLSPRTISSGNLFTNIDKSEYPHLFAKNGGLISKNPIKRFKSNFR